MQIIQCLHRGQRHAAEKLLDDLKLRALYLEEGIQQDVLMFAEQVFFQYDYDPYHKITSDVQRAADRLVEHLGFVIHK